MGGRWRRDGFWEEGEGEHHSRWKEVEDRGRRVWCGGRREAPHGRPLPRPGKATPRIPAAPTPLLCRGVFPASRCVTAAQTPDEPSTQGGGGGLEVAQLSADQHPKVVLGGTAPLPLSEQPLQTRTPP